MIAFYRKAAITSDPQCKDMVAKGAENFFAGSIHDEIWRTM
jgi:hypothetical protein